MSKLSWDAPGTRGFEIGVDRGVLFPDSNYGVAWSGLTAVTEKPSGGEARSYFIDGKKYLMDSSVTEFAATIEAFSAPPEFDRADGVRNLSVGLSQTHQTREPFAFSYRTKVGNDILSSELGYKLHVVYNAVVNPTEREYQTISDSIEPLKLSWDVETIGEISPGVNPTSHLIFDSRIIPAELMDQLELLLYGSEYSESQLIPQSTLLAAINTLPFAHQNIWANPSFETPSTTTAVVQTNYHNNPQAANNQTTGFGSGYGGWAGGDGNVNHIGYGVASDWSKSGLTARVKWDTVAQPAGDIAVYFGYSATLASFTSGQRVTLVFSYTTPTDGIPLDPPKLYGAANAQFTWVARSRETQILSEAGVIYEDWCTFDLPATWDDNSRMTVPVGPQTSGDYIETSMGNLYLGEYDPDKEWFSGTVSPDSAMTPSWVSDGNNSASQLTGVVPTRITLTGASKSVQSNEWHASKNNSVKVVPDGTKTDTFANLLDLTFVPGQTYTILATCHLENPQVNQIVSRPRRIVFFYKEQGSSTYTELYSDQAPNEAGTTEIRFMFTVPLGSSGYIVRLYNGSDRGAVWWDDVLITPEVYGGDYYDGDTESPDRWTSYSWDDPDAPDNSTSTKRDWVSPM